MTYVNCNRLAVVKKEAKVANGKILWFDSHRRCGEIDSENGDKVYFNKKSTKLKSLRPGQYVRFKTDWIKNHLVAVSVDDFWQ